MGRRGGEKKEREAPHYSYRKLLAPPLVFDLEDIRKGDVFCIEASIMLDGHEEWSRVNFQASLSSPPLELTVAQKPHPGSIFINSFFSQEFGFQAMCF